MRLSRDFKMPTPRPAQRIIINHLDDSPARLITVSAITADVVEALFPTASGLS
jgi:hypothetical protein